MKKWKTSSELKAMAKEQLLDNYGIAAGTYAIVFGITMGIFMLVYLALFALIISESINQGMNAIDSFIGSPLYFVITYALSGILGALICTVSTGYSYVCLKISRGEKPKVADLFYCFSHHPDKVIVLFLLCYLVELIILAPSQIVLYLISSGQNFSGIAFLFWALLYIAGLVFMVIFGLMISQMFFLYIDYPQEQSVKILKQSFKIMKGNKGRLFYVTISMFGWYLLLFASCCIAVFWIMPYQCVTFANFYRDLRGEFDVVNDTDTEIETETQTDCTVDTKETWTTETNNNSEQE